MPITNGSTIFEWTYNLELELQAARRRVAQLTDARTLAIGKVAQAAGVSPDMAAIMIDKAEAIRDALDPFDSGCRDQSRVQKGGANG